MKKRNPENERKKHGYFEFLKHAEGKSDATIRLIEKAIFRYEESTGFEDFRRFDQKKAMRFKEDLRASNLAAATILSTLNSLKRFMGWLSLQPGYKRQIKLTDIDYLSLSEKDVRAASAPADKDYPSLKMVEQVIAAMPSNTDTEKRDRALVAFTAITGIRDGALVTLKLKHFDPSRCLVLQNPLEVSTKFSKRIDTFLFPLNDDFEGIFIEWIDYLREDLFFTDNDPLFSKTAIRQDENNCFAAVGLSREHWANAGPIRQIFRRNFGLIGLPYFTPHSFRRMIIAEAYKRNLSHAQLKAWSQNLGHEGLLTTLTSYGKISIEEQERLIRWDNTEFEDENIREAVEFLRIFKKRGSA